MPRAASTAPTPSRYHKLVYDRAAIEEELGVLGGRPLGLDFDGYEDRLLLAVTALWLIWRLVVRRRR